MATVHYDVVIAGYGPTGLAAASLLARRGHRVCAFERWPSLYGLPRMATIDGESARILQAASDVDFALRRSVPRKRYLLANGRGQVLVAHDWDRPHVCGFPFRISLHQPDMEDAMDAAARQRGARIHQGWEVQEVSQTESCVTVVACERDSGARRTVSADYLIAADGARSAIREALGIENERWPARNAWLTFDARRKRKLPNFFGVSPDGQVAAIFCAPEGRTHSIIPLGLDHVRFNFQTHPDTPHDGGLDRELAYRRLRETYGIGEEDVDVYRQAVYPFEGRLASAWRAGRIFLAGDAAHVMTPFLGQGGCSALRDAINLAWKLDLVLRGVAGEHLLETYEGERKPHVRVHIEGSDKVSGLVFIADPAAADARDRKFFEGPPPEAPPEPALASGVLHSRQQPPVGNLAPQGVIAYKGKHGRFDDLMGWGFQLVAWGQDPRPYLRADQRRFLNGIGGAIAAIGEEGSDAIAIDRSGAYRRFFDKHGIEGLLMRPDFTVFGVAASAAELPGLVDSLREQLAYDPASAQHKSRKTP